MNHTTEITRIVPFFEYGRLYSDLREELDQAMKGVLERGAFILQHDLEAFEREIADYLGVAHCIGVGNCTDALLMALLAAGVGPGDEVILPAHTFVATAGAVHYAGATPIPVDCRSDHLIDPSAIAAAITDRTAAIIPVSLNGRACDFAEITSIALEHRLPVIEDSAQALGARYQSTMAGTAGLAGTFSFYPAKILGCFGDAGAVVTDSDAVAEYCFRYRDHGRDPRTGEVLQWGMNSRMDNLQAAVLSTFFKYYARTIDRRRAIAGTYDAGLRDIAELTLPPAPDSDPNHFDTYQNYEIEADRRDDLRAFLSDAGIGTIVQWGGKGIHQHQALGLTADAPVADGFIARMVLLPMNMFVADEDIDHVISSIRHFYGY